MKKFLILFSLIIFACLACTSCQPVRAWERGTLAKSEMAIDADPMESTLNDHIFFSKEASNGGHNATGGGCGCN